ncbi:unnamed protein product [Lepeophtheirus salmonis]|uniref:(salmon louse) hypothetical protein n=1 Tax=Lepeophtheirus salmonis TaxID=72036 RepID=A0A7R8CQC3_LEPSM|nr:unnamed protein product [Lepeophtheirus salmonis]CAF2893878.1 unnamed protein product [Lepeophtheirus salmonis]
MGHLHIDKGANVNIIPTRLVPDKADPTYGGHIAVFGGSKNSYWWPCLSSADSEGFSPQKSCPCHFRLRAAYPGIAVLSGPWPYPDLKVLNTEQIITPDSTNKLAISSTSSNNDELLAAVKEDASLHLAIEATRPAHSLGKNCRKRAVKIIKDLMRKNHGTSIDELLFTYRLLLSRVATRLQNSYFQGQCAPRLDEYLHTNTSTPKEPIKKILPDLIQKEELLDVTLISGSNQIKAHKIILSACLPAVWRLDTVIKSSKVASLLTAMQNPVKASLIKEPESQDADLKILLSKYAIKSVMQVAKSERLFADALKGTKPQRKRKFSGGFLYPK